MAASQEHSAGVTQNPIFTLSGDGESVYCMAWLSNDRIVTGSLGKTVRIWNLTNGTQEGTSMVHEHLLRACVTTKDGRIISCSQGDDHLLVWNADTQELVDGPRSNKNYGAAHWIALSQSEELLASCHDKWIVLWKMEGTMRVRSYIDESSGWFDSRRGKMACFSDGKRLVFSDSRKLVERGEPMFGRLEFDSFYITTPFLWSFDGSIRCLDSSTGETIGEPWTGDGNTVSCLSLALNGKWLVSGSFGEPWIRFWDVGSGDVVGEPLHHASFVSEIAFS